MLVQCLRTTMNATAPRPINAINAPYPGDLVGVGVGFTVVGTGVATVVGAAVVGTGVGTAVGAAPSRTLNSAVSGGFLDDSVFSNNVLVRFEC